MASIQNKEEKKSSSHVFPALPACCMECFYIIIIIIIPN
jgi:hypothetical protein